MATKSSQTKNFSLQIVHYVPSRIRLKYQVDPSYLVDFVSLETRLQSCQGFKHVRFNTKLQNIIIGLDKHTSKENVLELVEKNFKESLVSALDSVKNHTHLVALEEKPKLTETILAGSSLCLQPFLNPTPKMLLSTGVSAPVLLSGAKELFEDGITSRVLEALAVGISLLRKDFTTANSTNLMLALGEYIEQATLYKSDDLIKELSKPQGVEAWVEKSTKNGEKQLVLTPANSIQIGDIVVVGAGESIIVDGHVVSGEALVNQISMTGEATPVSKARGDRVLSGTVVVEGKIKVWSEGVGSATATSRIKAYIQNTLEEKSSRELRASKMADGLVPITLGLAGVSYLFSGDWMRMASVLQADYSCALKLATPVSFKSTISSAGREGILIKGAKSLEALNECDVFVFDKTGTLTNGNLEVVEVYSFRKDWSEDRILNLAASIEEHYFHPVAEAVVRAARERSFVHTHHDEVTFIVAHGVKSEVNSKMVVIGSKHFLEDDEKINFSEHQAMIDKLLESGHTPLFIGYGGELLGIILLKDSLRDNAKESLERLRKYGVKEVIMLTGDIEKKAKEIAKSLGVDRYYAQLLPAQKAEILEKIMSEGNKVTFVGDGINDAPALIRADCGIGMCKGADIAKASADVVLLRDDISAVADAKEFATLCLSKVQNGFKITVGVNSLILGLAALGKLTPIQTAFLHNGTTIALLLNAVRPVKVDKNNLPQ